MKKNITFYVYSIIQVLLINACLFGSTTNETKEKSVPASDLLVDVSVFPEGWSSSICTSSDCRKDGGITSAEGDYYVKGQEGHVFEEVYRFTTTDDAINLYNSYYKGETKKPDVREPFEEFTSPKEVHFESKFAEKGDLVCGVDVIPQCKYFAQYENYFIYFYFDHAIEKGDGGLTYDEIEIVLEEFEGKIESIDKGTMQNK